MGDKCNTEYLKVPCWAHCCAICIWKIYSGLQNQVIIESQHNLKRPNNKKGCIHKISLWINSNLSWIRWENTSAALDNSHQIDSTYKLKTLKQLKKTEQCKLIYPATRNVQKTNRIQTNMTFIVITRGPKTQNSSGWF